MESCSYYLELLSLSLDDSLTPKQQADLQHHLDQCPECRLLAQQLTEIHSELSAWEDQPVPEGFTQQVMDQIRTPDTPKNIIPLWKRPQFKAIGSLAACALLCVGVWSSGLFSGGTAMDSTEAMRAPAAAAPAGEAAPAAEPASAAPEAPAAPSGSASYSYQAKSEAAFDSVLADQAPAEPTLPAPTALEQKSPESKLTSSGVIVSETSAPLLSLQRGLPDDITLMEMAAQAVGTAPGTLYLAQALPAELEDYGTWYTAQGMMFFLFDPLPGQSEQQTLTNAAEYQVGQGEQPLVLLIIE